MLTPGIFACPACRRCENCFDEIEYAKKIQKECIIRFRAASVSSNQKSVGMCEVYYWFMCTHSLRHAMCLKAEGSDYSGNVAWFLMCIAEEYNDSVICQMKANSTRHILEMDEIGTCFLPSTELTVCCVYAFVFSYATSCRHSFFRALTRGRASPQRRRGVAESWEVVFRTGWRLAEVWKDFKSTSYQNLFFLGVILLLLDPLKD